jgi:uncharacterized protein
MVTIPDAARTRMALAGCVALLGVTAILVGTVIPAWAYPLINTAAAAALITFARAAGATPQAIGFTLGRRTLLAALIGLAAVTAVLALAWTLPYTRQVFAASPAASITSTDLLWVVLIRVPFGTVLLEEVAFRGCSRR